MCLLSLLCPFHQLLSTKAQHLLRWSTLPQRPGDLPGGEVFTSHPGRSPSPPADLDPIYYKVAVLCSSSHIKKTNWIRLGLQPQCTNVTHRQTHKDTHNPQYKLYCYHSWLIKVIDVIISSVLKWIWKVVVFWSKCMDDEQMGEATSNFTCKMTTKWCLWASVITFTHF